jgi:branched-chain amino acid transport system permease protein
MKLGRDLVAILLLLLVAGIAGTVADDYWVGLGISLMMAVALTQSWAILSALSGYVSLGHVVFYGLGAYLVVVTWNEIPLWAALPLAALAAGVFAAIIGFPVLRVRGPYFVILTFGVAELVKYVMIAGESALGHASRLILGAPDPIDLFYIMLGLAAAAAVMSYVVRRTRLGHGLRAIRESEEAAETIGVPVAFYKLAGFVLSAIIPGAVGGVMALRATYFEPRVVFDPMISFSMIAMTIIGGSDDLKGPVIGAVLLTALSEALWANAPEAYMIILGILLVLFVRFLPGGIGGLIARGRQGDARAA